MVKFAIAYLLGNNSVSVVNLQMVKQTWSGRTSEISTQATDCPAPWKHCTIQNNYVWFERIQNNYVYPPITRHRISFFKPRVRRYCGTVTKNLPGGCACASSNWPRFPVFKIMDDRSAWAVRLTKQNVSRWHRVIRLLSGVACMDDQQTRHREQTIMPVDVCLYSVAAHTAGCGGVAAPAKWDRGTQ